MKMVAGGNLERQHLVLIAEDEPNNRAILQTVVEDFIGARVALAADGQEALAAVARERPDVILLDLMMPRVDGFDVARQVRADPANAPVRIVALTALSRVADQDAALAAGCDAFVAKPFDLDEVERTIRALLS